MKLFHKESKQKKETPQPAHGKKEPERLCCLCSPGAHAVLLHHYGPLPPATR